MDFIEQFAVVDKLLENWDAIRAKMGPISAASELELARIAARLAAADNADDLARALADLVQLTQDTPASDYVRQLLSRSKSKKQTRRSQPAVFAHAADEILSMQSAANMTGNALGRAAGVAYEGTRAVPVFFATNRRRDEAQPPESRFSGEPADAITLGLAQVSIPFTHKTGKVETPAWWNLFADPKDASRYVILYSVERLAEADFCTKLTKAATEGGPRSVLVFLHGYNVTFEEAARRAAQFASDMKYAGAVVLFSWPSLGETFGYLADEERAMLSADRLVEFLRVLEGGPWDAVHIVAHSMGNRVVVLGLADNKAPALPLGQIVFIAADVYVETFQQKFPKMSGLGKLKTSYVSRKDRALLLSSWLHRARRIGISDGEPFVSKGMETIDASSVDTSLLSLGHGYFGDTRSVITDLGYLLREGLPAARRGLESASGKDYWDIPR